VILAYLQVLNNEDLLSSAIAQKSVSEKQLERLNVLDRQGAISPSQVTDVKGQLMNDELNILNMRNNLETAKLSLAQLMNVPYDKSMTLERMNADDFLTAYAVSSSDVYQNALQQFSLAPEKLRVCPESGKRNVLPDGDAGRKYANELLQRSAKFHRQNPLQRPDKEQRVLQPEPGRSHSHFQFVQDTQRR
jgi:S-adenosylmethionine:tRNA-ribosyltransferase-isomerase (queuine synthetase)